MKPVVKSLVIELLGLEGGLRRPILGLSEGVSWIWRKSEACSKKFNNKIAWFGRGAPEADFGPLGRGPLGSGGKVKLVVKSLVIELLGLDGGLRRRILGLSEGVLLDLEEKCSL